MIFWKKIIIQIIDFDYDTTRYIDSRKLNYEWDFLKIFRIQYIFFDNSNHNVSSILLHLFFKIIKDDDTNLLTQILIDS